MRSVHVAPLCMCHTLQRTSAFHLRHVIGLLSIPTIQVGFLVMSVVSFDVLLLIDGRVIVGYSLTAVSESNGNCIIFARA